jgi:hypothetical protein
MSRRIEVELTSSRDDGTWTWRAAGAKLPKGELDGSLLFTGAQVGDVVRADADFMMDGIVIVGVLAPKGARKEPERIEIVGTPRRDDEPLVTSTLAPKGSRGGDRKPRRDADDRRPRRDGADRKPGDRKPRSEGEGASGPRPDRRDRPARAPRPAPEPKPKPKRLRAGRTHRNEVLASLPAEQKPIAEQVLRGGIPAVRVAVEKQNETNKAEGTPEISPAPLLTLAEELMPALRTAEWRDKAEAAIADMAELDLRDLRSVVVASDVAARDEECRALADQLKVGLSQRVESEHAAWLAEIAETLDSGRAVRALRVSSRPPKAGAPLPPELAVRLADAAAASLTPDTGSDRYATVLDALAFSPVRTQVTPTGIPAEPTPELLAAVKKVAGRLPAIAAMFGIEAAPASKAGRPRSKPRPPKPVLPSAPATTPSREDDIVVLEETVVELDDGTVVTETVVESITETPGGGTVAEIVTDTVTATADGTVIEEIVSDSTATMSDGATVEEIVTDTIVETPDGTVVVETAVETIVDEPDGTVLDEKVTDIVFDSPDGDVIEIVDVVDETIIETMAETANGVIADVVDRVDEIVIETVDGVVVDVTEEIEVEETEIVVLDADAEAASEGPVA